ncbi:MAG: hypothetical protein WCS88_04810 [Patescibacteria group bacterium]|jgi:hypothetical protein
MKVFKNQAGFNDVIMVVIIGGILGSLFVLGVFVWKEIEIFKIENKISKLINEIVNDNLNDVAIINNRDQLIDLDKKGFLYLSCEGYSTRNVLYQYSGYFDYSIGNPRPITILPSRCDDRQFGFDGDYIYYVNIDGGIDRYNVINNNIENINKAPEIGQIHSLLSVTKTTLFAVAGQCFVNGCQLLRYNTVSNEYEIIIDSLNDKVEQNIVYGDFKLLDYNSSSGDITALYAGGDAGMGGVAIYSINVPKGSITLLDSASFNACDVEPECPDPQIVAENKRFEEIFRNNNNLLFKTCNDYSFERQNDGEIIVKNKIGNTNHSFNGQLIGCIE